MRKKLLQTLQDTVNCSTGIYFILADYHLVLYCYFSSDPAFVCYTKESVCFCFIAFTVPANMQKKNDWCSVRFLIFHDMIFFNSHSYSSPYIFLLLNAIHHFTSFFLLPFSTFSTFFWLKGQQSCCDNHCSEKERQNESFIYC